MATHSGKVLGVTHGEAGKFVHTICTLVDNADTTCQTEMLWKCTLTSHNCPCLKRQDKEANQCLQTLMEMYKQTDPLAVQMYAHLTL